MRTNLSQYDYQRVEQRADNHDSFKLVTGEWSGTVITFGEVAVQHKLDGSPPKLNFQYQIEETPLDPKELEANVDFNEYIGDILVHVIEEALEENNFAIGEQPDGTESTNDNTEEFN
jgi:hypothetical protein